MGSNVAKIEGYQARGGEMPWINPNNILIVGLDVPETADNWFAQCPRAKEEVDEEFLESVRKEGVRLPVDVYRDGARVLTLEGRRRVKGARIVWEENKKKGVKPEDNIAVRVNIRHGSPEELFKFNAQSHQGKKDLDPVQLAMLMANFQKHASDDVEKTANVFACSVGKVRQHLALLNLHPKVQREVSGFHLSIKNANKLAGLPREEQVAKLEEYKSEVIAPSESDGTNGTARTAPPRRSIVIGPKPQPARVINRARVYVDSIDNETAKLVGQVLAWVQGEDDKVKDKKLKAILTEAASN